MDSKQFTSIDLWLDNYVPTAKAKRELVVVVVVAAAVVVVVVPNKKNPPKNTTQKTSCYCPDFVSPGRVSSNVLKTK